MRIQSIRFSEWAWEEIQYAARQQGVSASQYVRQSALAHAMFDRARAGGERAEEIQRHYDRAAEDNGHDEMD